MKLRTIALAGAATLAAAAPAAASPDATVTPDAPVATWNGPAANGLNTSFFLDGIATTGSCANTDEQTRCDSTKVFIDADTYASNAKLTFRIEGFRQVDDFDLRVYDLGTKPNSAGTYLGSPTSTDVSNSSPLGSDDPRYTSAGDFENKEVTGIKADRWYRVDVVYFATAGGTYTGKVTATGLGKTVTP